MTLAYLIGYVRCIALVAKGWIAEKKFVTSTWNKILAQHKSALLPFETRRAPTDYSSAINGVLKCKEHFSFVCLFRHFTWSLSLGTHLSWCAFILLMRPPFHSNRWKRLLPWVADDPKMAPTSRTSTISWRRKCHTTWPFCRQHKFPSPQVSVSPARHFL